MNPVSRDAECKSCGAPFIRYNTIQALCRDCSLIRQKKLQEKARIGTSLRRVIEMQGEAREGKPLRTISSVRKKPINQYGKVQRLDAIFRDKEVRPYLEKNFGIACAECKAMPPMLDSGEFSRHAIDHIQGKGPHPELRFVITNFQFLCLPCHEAKTGVPMWTPKAAA